MVNLVELKSMYDETRRWEARVHRVGIILDHYVCDVETAEEIDNLFNQFELVEKLMVSIGPRA